MRRKSKTKKTDDDKSHRCEDELQNVSKNTNETAIIESEMVKTDTVSPSDSSTPITEPEQTYAEEEIDEEPLPIDQSTPEKNKKKFSWRSSLRRDKSKERSVETKPVDIEGNDELNIDSEKKSTKKTFLEKVGSLKRSPKTSPSKENVLFERVESSSERELSPPISENSDNKTNVNKKKKILASLRLSKSDKPEKQAQQTGCSPSLFSSCTNSNIKPNQDRKLSSDSIEVKTIASYEGEAQDREVTPIRIIRNDFFPEEVLDNRKKPNYVIQEEAEEKSEKISTKEVENKMNERSADNSTNTEEDVTIEKKSPVADKKYGVIENDDFSESLHTLVGDHDPNFLLLSSSDVANDITTASKSCEAAKPGNDNVDDNSLPQGTFRTSCSLSIEDSNKDEKESSDDTLVGSDTLKKSTDTLTQANVEPNLKDWVDITGVDDAQFKYIYLKTVQNIQQEDKMKPETSQEVPKVILSSNEIPSVTVESSGSTGHKENNCEKCGKVVQEKEGETEAKSTPKAKCICTTMTRVRRSIGELEEGNVKSKVAVLDKSERPIILPLRKGNLEFRFKKLTRNSEYLLSNCFYSHPHPSIL
ncbi:hypothetical protein WA026_005995 [Henosepilachna vigintioctopunctata]|uniref:Uncharacterized protein n=1 Tax=Henosepilachna vigintioctopunctata TaxID=420089 RepID=A0AAW1U2L8_9CUCU